VTPFVTGGAGFLLAVLWFDLMFDVQVAGHDGEELPEPVLASIAGYYARVTTAARPMNRLIASTAAALLRTDRRRSGAKDQSRRRRRRTSSAPAKSPSTASEPGEMWPQPPGSM